MFQNERHVAVIGGGISGLICAYRLLRKGVRVTLFEASGEAGGRGAAFEFEGRRIDCFGNAARETDGNLLALLKEFGLAGETQFKKTTWAVLEESGSRRLDTPAGLLGLDGLSVSGRARAAWGAWRLGRMRTEPKGLGRITAAAWLEGVFGREMYGKYWRPLLRARFGEKGEEAPAQWAWNELGRETGAARERRTEFRAGELTKRLLAEIIRRGGRVRLGTEVEAVRDEGDLVGICARGRWESFDAAVCTLAMPRLRQIADGSIVSQLPRRDLAYRGIVNAAVVLNRRLQRHFSVTLRREDLAFDGVMETEEALHLYAYCDASDDTWRQADADIQFQALRALRALNASFTPEWVEEIEVFRSAYAEPVWGVEAHLARPRMRCGLTRLYLATPAQCYPRPDGWNTIVGMANDIAGRVDFDLRNAPERKLALAV